MRFRFLAGYSRRTCALTADFVSARSAATPVAASRAPAPPARRYRAIFISDVHLGTRGCKAEYLLDFLCHNESDVLYLVGDVIDGSAVRSGSYWPQAHDDVVQKVLRKARTGTRVVCVLGNHDEFVRQFVGLEFGGISLADEVEHRFADGRRPNTVPSRCCASRTRRSSAAHTRKCRRFSRVSCAWAPASAASRPGIPGSTAPTSSSCWRWTACSRVTRGTSILPAKRPADLHRDRR